VITSPWSKGRATPTTNDRIGRMDNFLQGMGRGGVQEALTPALPAGMVLWGTDGG
jgi:hypothetical protein